MAAVKTHNAVLKKLKQQVSALQRKEKAASKKLQNALVKAKKMGKAFKRKLNLKAKEVKTKVAAIEAAVYHKLADSIKKKAKTVKSKKVKKAVVVKKAKKPVTAKAKVAKRLAKQKPTVKRGVSKVKK